MFYISMCNLNNLLTHYSVIDFSVSRVWNTGLLVEPMLTCLAPPVNTQPHPLWCDKLLYAEHEKRFSQQGDLYKSHTWVFETWCAVECGKRFAVNVTLTDTSSYVAFILPLTCVTLDMCVKVTFLGKCFATLGALNFSHQCGLGCVYWDRSFLVNLFPHFGYAEDVFVIKPVLAQNGARYFEFPECGKKISLQKAISTHPSSPTLVWEIIECSECGKHLPRNATLTHTSTVAQVRGNMSVIFVSCVASPSLLPDVSKQTCEEGISLVVMDVFIPNKGLWITKMY